jgi:hypothetical protein
MELTNVLGGLLWFALGFMVGVIYITENFGDDDLEN